MKTCVLNGDELTDAGQIIALVSRPSPETVKMDSPVDALLATAYALHPENLSVTVIAYLDDLFEKHMFFRKQIKKIRAARSYYINMETAE